MESNLRVFVTSIFITISVSSFAQLFNEHGYRYLTDWEFDEIIKRDGGKNLNGNYYIMTKEKSKVVSIAVKKYLDGEKNGEWILFSDTFRGLKIVSVKNYKRGIKEGYSFDADYFSYSSQGSFKKGKKHGLWIDWDEYSEIKTYYKNGVKHGKFWKKDTNGFIEEGVYKNDKKQGVWILRDEGKINNEAIILEKKVYKNDILITSKKEDE